jgi:hypothetical protein
MTRTLGATDEKRTAADAFSLHLLEIYRRVASQREPLGPKNWIKSRAGPSPFQEQKENLFDDLVGLCEEQLRHGEAERFGGLQVDDQ